MEENILLDAIERYRNGEMSSEEKTYFEDLRKQNSEIDQVAAEHLFFLNEFDKFRKVNEFKHTLNEVESKLESEGLISTNPNKGKAKIINLWTKYRRTIAVAACIAGVVSLSTASLVSRYSVNKKSEAITPLVDNKLHQMEHKINQMENKLNDATTAIAKKPKFEANFRATGFLADGSGYLITNAHVVDKAKNLIVENTKGEQFTAVPVYSNATTDLAILKITDTTFKKINSLPYTFLKATAELAEPVFTMGYPREEVVYGEGYLSAKSGFYGDTSSYQISISANPGNSGGPVINRNGEIIGIISSKETNADGVVFAVKSRNIYTALKEVRANNDIAIKLPQVNNLKGLDRVHQIKKIEDFIYKVKGN
ncbi:MAG: trypsin-like peptidase domain-containing protein [Bacteroidetes bacterium]|nr:trypsin-like peptidase domain-containing protein [Bacteroidota bacterium]